MRLPVVSRAEFERVESERDEWKRRAIAAEERLAERQQPLPHSPKPRRWPAFVAALWLLFIGVGVGGTAIPRADDKPTLAPDYPTCISMYRADNQLEDKHQELVNALYACGIYGN